MTISKFLDDSGSHERKKASLWLLITATLFAILLTFIFHKEKQELSKQNSAQHD